MGHLRNHDIVALTLPQVSALGKKLKLKSGDVEMQISDKQCPGQIKVRIPDPLAPKASQAGNLSLRPDIGSAEKLNFVL